MRREGGREGGEGGEGGREGGLEGGREGMEGGVEGEGRRETINVCGFLTGVEMCVWGGGRLME